jgi:hypothetical protein
MWTFQKSSEGSPGFVSDSGHCVIDRTACYVSLVCDFSVTHLWMLRQIADDFTLGLTKQRILVRSFGHESTDAYEIRNHVCGRICNTNKWSRPYLCDEETEMTDEIESYGEFESQLTELLQQARQGGLEPPVLAGVLLDYRDHIKMEGDVPGN